MTLTAGTKLGPYEIMAPLGAGGMGEVYRARDARLGRDVAVKVLPERLAEDADALARFEREAKAVAALSHPNILALHDVGREGRVAYAVMELLEGETLRRELETGPLSARRAVDYGVQVAHGLAAAHEKGIVHRDLKPDNVFVTRDDRVKILDFGLAKGSAGPAAGSETESPTVSGYTEPGKVMGTVGYMSPEQVRGIPVDARSDIFSFGSVLYEMLTGRRAFHGETAAEAMTAILRDEPEELAGSGSLPLALAPVVRHCLEKKPEKRFQSARDLAFALETASASSASVPVPVAGAPLRVTSAWKRIGVAALVGAAAIGGYLVHPRAAVSTEPDWSDVTLRLLTTDPGYEGEPTFSPDGRTIAYVSDREGNFEIYLQQIDGGPAINLTKNPAADIQPAFSPDGREIAFVSNRSGTSDILHAAPGLPVVGGDIWIMPALGGPARRIVERGDFPSWAPDGSALLYVHGTFRNAHIARVPASGGEGRDIPIEEKYVARYFFPRMSDDGRWLLYQNGNQIEVVAASGGTPKVLAVGQYPAWGAGSTSILYTNGDPGKGRSLWRASFSLAKGGLSGDSTPLTFGRGSDVGAAASRDGRSIAFAALDESLDLEEIPFDAEAGRVTGAPIELTPGNNRVGFFDPSPDGKAVVFAAERGEASDLYRVDPPAVPVQLTRDANYSDSNPVWSPDGKQIAFSRAPKGAPDAGSALWLMTADGTNPRRVTDFSGEMIWLSDRKVVIERGENLLRFDLASGATEPFDAPKMRTLLAVDSTRQWIAYQAVDAGSVKLAAVAIAGGPVRSVDTGAFDAYHPFFSPSNRWIYFQPAHKNLYRVPGPAQGWATAEPEKVTDFSGIDLYIEDPKISRDGSKLFYTRGRRAGNIVILRFGNGGNKKAKS